MKLLSWPEKISVWIMIVLFVVVFAVNIAMAHSWYDFDCCGDNDCEPVKVQLDNQRQFCN